MNAFKLLLAVGVDLAAVEYVGRTVLHFAPLKGMGEMMLMLADNGGDIMAKDNIEKTPYDLAASTKLREMVKSLQEQSPKRKLSVLCKYT
jgi:ankyrin repeat protein